MHEGESSPEQQAPLKSHAQVQSPLLECLLLLCRHYKISASASSLTAGLPLDNGQMDEPLFVRCADRAGLSARHLQISLEQLTPLVLPAVLLLKNGKACLLTALDHKKGFAQVIITESGSGSEDVPLETLAEQYTGEALFVKEKHRYDERTPRTLKLL